MMYFTEGPDATEDSTQLNDQFEAKYEMATYEVKVSKLLHRAHATVKRENPETARTWNDSIRILRKGDHYILVLWGTPCPPYDDVKLVTALLAAALLSGITLTGGHYSFHWSSWLEGHRTPAVWSL